MRQNIALFLCLALTVTGLLPTAALAEQSRAMPVSTAPTPHSYPVFDNSIQLLENQGKLVAVQRLSGKEAYDHLQQVRDVKGEAFGHSVALMASQGYRPTKVAVVVRTVRVDKLISEGVIPSSAVPVGTEISNQEGEVIFWSWDDGNDGTWEGVTYVAKYSTGQWATYNSQVNIQVPQYSTVWAQMTGGSIQEENQDVLDRGPQRMNGFLQAISRGGGVPATPLAVASSPRAPGVGLAAINANQEFEDFVICSVGFCYICAEGCIFAGPFWPECFGLCCFLSILFCAWYHFF
jgi:hypothetical protein